jgi:quinol monooxygenase YgiN
MITLISGITTAVATAAALAGAAAPSSREAQAVSYPIVELRQYTLHDGERDTLIKLFEREFIESQEALGMKVIGTFRDLDRPNRFVWIRGFADMDARLAGESAFYGGPVWQAHRNEANATMIDSDDVLLLQAAAAGAAFKREPSRPGLGEKRQARLVVATIYYLKGEPSKAARRFHHDAIPGLNAAGATPLAWFITETATNNYPRLPVREGERVLVWFARFDSEDDYGAHKPAMDKAAAELAPDLAREPEVLRLQPTDRSELR